MAWHGDAFPDVAGDEVLQQGAGAADVVAVAVGQGEGVEAA
jgi:hypothetical protein